MQFVDEVHISVRSGKGGAGCVSFRRESHVPRGGPDGGDGGHGGNVEMVVNPQLSSLIDLKYKSKYNAGDGQPGKGQNRSGPDGADLILQVPPGTVVKNTENKSLIVDLADQESYLLLKGGMGGKGNSFYKNSVHQAPEIAQKGMPCEELDVTLELKILADIGIIGFPNVGKSTLISRISAAKPKIADYHFTTLVPNLGVVKVEEGKNFVVADIPGLVEGAHKGVGLGSQFLRHIERTRAFVHVIDVTSSSTYEPIKSYNLINEELSSYDSLMGEEGHLEPLSTRKQIVVLNKVDSVPEEDLAEVIKSFKEELGLEVLCISAVTGKNIQPLIYKMADLVYGKDGEDDDW